jgi:hypothetical protein
MAAFDEVQLTDGSVALVSPDDVALLSGSKWRRFRGSTTDYAARTSGDHELMHRVLMDCTKGDGQIVDHKNHNGLDNRRGNLRVVTRSQNGGNSRPRRSLPKGVYKNHERWMARIGKENKYLGTFDTIEEAAAAYDAAAVSRFGEAAYVNGAEHGGL